MGSGTTAVDGVLSRYGGDLMSWYSSNWPSRAAITIDNSGASGTVDVQFTIPTDLEPFWTDVLASGADIRITAYDGVTLLAYEVAAGFSKTTRTCTIKINDYALTATAGTYSAWLYWGYASASSASAAQVLAAPVSADICRTWPSPPWIVPVRAEPVSAVRPRFKMSKKSSESVYVWWDITEILERRTARYNGSDRLEECYRASMDVTTGGDSQAAMFDQTKQLFVEVGGRMYVGCLLKAGADGTDYTLVLTIGTRKDTTGDSRKLQARAWLQVRDVDEA